MSEVVVSQLAENIGTPVDRLLKQMEDAGLPQRKVSDSVSDEQKEVLLKFLRESHGGDVDSGPKKITLKRKTVSTLKTGSGTARKTVSVEVRKKRTYVKREDANIDEPEDQLAIEQEVLAATEMAATEAVVEVPAVETLSVVEEKSEQEVPVVVESVAEAAVIPEKAEEAEPATEVRAPS